MNKIVYLLILFCFSAICHAQQVIHFEAPVYLASPDDHTIAHIESSYDKEDKSTKFEISLFKGNNENYPFSKIEFPKFVPTRCAGYRRNLNDVAFTPNGKYLITVTGWWSIYSYEQQLMCDDRREFNPGQIAVWDVQTGTLKALLSYPDQEKHTADFHTVTCSSDGKYIAVMGDEAVRIWRGKTFKYIRKLPWSNYAEKLVFSPDSNLLLGGRRGVSWLLWDVGTGKLLRKLADTGAGKEDVADDLYFSEDNNRIVGTLYEWGATEKGPMGIWETRTGELLHQIYQPTIPTKKRPLRY